MLRILTRRIVQAYVEAGPKGVWLRAWRKVKQRLRRGATDSGTAAAVEIP